jgi:alkylhydroperoxidase/carboxymuconolactone decarboxylase family protein YurZ
MGTRQGPDAKTRALICVVADAGTRRAPELAVDLPIALRQGWIEDEFNEALLYLPGYVCAPTTREAMRAPSKVFVEFRAEPADTKPASA